MFLSILFVDNTDDVSFVVLQQLSNFSFVDLAGDLRLFFTDIFVFLHEGIGDGHSGESLLTSVGSGFGMASHSGQKTKVQIKSLHEPVDGMARFFG